MLTISRDHIWKLILLTFIGSIISISVSKYDVLFLGILISLVFLILLVKNPEMSLAIHFNGTLIYFYIVFMLGIDTSRLLTGSFYAYLVFSYFIGGLLLETIKNRKFKVKSVDVLFICFFLMCLLSYIFYSIKQESAYVKIAYAPLLVIAPYFGIQLLNSKKRIINFFKYSVVIATLLIIPAFYELFFNPIVIESSRFSMYLIAGESDNPILFGITYSLLLIITLVWIIEQNKFIPKYLILIIPSAFLLLRSNSRGALLSFLITMLFYIVLLTVKIRFKKKVYLILLLFLIFGGGFQYMPESASDFFRFTFMPEATMQESSSIYQRLFFWEMTFNEFMENPLLGVGFGNSVEGMGFPHNILLEVSAELGIIGFLIFLMMLFLTVEEAIKYIKSEKDKDLCIMMKISLLLFIFSLSEAMFSGYITNQTHLFMSMGLIISLAKYKQNNTSSLKKQFKA